MSSKRKVGSNDYSPQDENGDRVKRIALSFDFPPFDCDNESWDHYILSFESELSLHDLLDSTDEEIEDMRRKLLLSKMGSAPFNVLVDQCYPLAALTYLQIKSILSVHYLQSPYVLAERVKFCRRMRGDNESVTQFVDALGRLASNCEFGVSFDERMRDQLLLGINDDDFLQKLTKLHPSNQTTFADIRSSILVLERIKSKLKFSKGARSTSNVPTKCKSTQNSHFDQDGEIPKGKCKLVKGRHCFKCSLDCHRNGVKCPASDSTCLACNNIGHFTRACVKSGRAEIVIIDSSKTNRIAENISTTLENDSGNNLN